MLLRLGSDEDDAVRVLWVAEEWQRWMEEDHLIEYLEGGWNLSWPGDNLIFTLNSIPDHGLDHGTVGCGTVIRPDCIPIQRVRGTNYYLSLSPLLSHHSFGRGLTILLWGTEAREEGLIKSQVVADVGVRA